MNIIISVIIEITVNLAFRNLFNLMKNKYNLNIFSKYILLLNRKINAGLTVTRIF